MNPISMQVASKCAVFHILLYKIHLYFCVPFPLSTLVAMATLNFHRLIMGKMKIDIYCRYFDVSCFRNVG